MKSLWQKVTLFSLPHQKMAISLPHGISLGVLHRQHAPSLNQSLRDLLHSHGRQDGKWYAHYKCDKHQTTKHMTQRSVRAITPNPEAWGLWEEVLMGRLQHMWSILMQTLSTVNMFPSKCVLHQISVNMICFGHIIMLVSLGFHHTSSTVIQQVRTTFWVIRLSGGLQQLWMFSFDDFDHVWPLLFLRWRGPVRVVNLWGAVPQLSGGRLVRAVKSFGEVWERQRETSEPRLHYNRCNFFVQGKKQLKREGLPKTHAGRRQSWAPPPKFKWTSGPIISESELGTSLGLGCGLLWPRKSGGWVARPHTIDVQNFFFKKTASYGYSILIIVDIVGYSSNITNFNR